MLRADAVTASIPLSLSSLARPKVIEKVEQEFRRLSVLGVFDAVDWRLFVVPVHSLLPTKLKTEN